MFRFFLDLEKLKFRVPFKNELAGLVIALKGTFGPKIGTFLATELQLKNYLYNFWNICSDLWVINYIENIVKISICLKRYFWDKKWSEICTWGHFLL